MTKKRSYDPAYYRQYHGRSNADLAEEHSKVLGPTCRTLVKDGQPVDEQADTLKRQKEQA